MGFINLKKHSNNQLLFLASSLIKFGAWFELGLKFFSNVPKLIPKYSTLAKLNCKLYDLRSSTCGMLETCVYI